MSPKAFLHLLDGAQDQRVRAYHDRHTTKAGLVWTLHHAKLSMHTVREGTIEVAVNAMR
ncbi:hypothetical protein DPMN_038053 [Dreissena polymorpha]|uniref:Uncharacterized protein n=1 Tax=Dreissena polymorpha TaxID=45954 RepID=A0A9D4RQC4_DREPO|nr:hypothetical protein DPMN_038053 [Dreissena polymorpha]